MDPETDLMQRVERLAGPYLDAFAPSSVAPEAWWAALTANETGIYLIHNLEVPPRFEPGVLRHLQNVQDGVDAEYAGVTQADLQGMSYDDLKPYASSWGLTQVMGYHAIRWGAPRADLNDPSKHYQLADRLLREFVAQFKLDPTVDFDKMFRCWNSGSPDGTTFDPRYVENGVNRMKIWEAL